MIDLSTPAGGFQAYLATSEAPTGGSVIVLQEWWGLVDQIKGVADRLASAGFNALAPDLYGGETTDSPDEAGRQMMELNLPLAASQLEAALTYLRAQRPDEKVGVLGFCMGGQLALYSACLFPEQLHAVVDFYGIHPKVELDLRRLQAPVLAHFGKADEFIPESSAHSLVSRVREAGGSIDAHFYEAGHAFFNETRPGFDAASAQLAWDRSEAFLRASLA